MVRYDELTFDFQPGTTALVVVDMLDVFVDEGAVLETPSAREMVPHLRDVLDRCRELGVQIVFLRYDNRPSGVDAGQLATITPQIHNGLFEDTSIYEGLEPHENDVIVDKHSYDGFFETELDTVLRTLDVETVAITGTRTHICCDATLRGAFSRGYQVVAIEDLVATAPISDQGWGDVDEGTLDRVWFSTVATNYGEVVDAEEFLDKLNRTDPVEDRSDT